MNELSGALAILSAMITPAILIMACGSLILTTSQRLGRVIERTRKITTEIEKFGRETLEVKIEQEERVLLFEQMGRASKRCRLLQRALSSLYLSLSFFVATSISLGIVAVSHLKYSWIPISFGILGSCLLFYTSILLIIESRIALFSVDEEMDFVLRMRTHFIPLQKYKK